VVVLFAVGVLAAGMLVTGAPAATPVRLALTTSTPKPVVDTPWRWTVTVRTVAGRGLRAKMRLQILLGETVVGCWKGMAMVQCLGPREGTWISFRGKKSGTLRWPAQSLGVRLTFQAAVVVNERTHRLRAPVTVQSA
jgi:hypothetical protein